MSTNVAKTILIGPTQIYWNDVRMGSPMSQAAVRYNKETVQAGLPDSGMNEISRKIKETCEVDVVIADFKLDQMRYAYDQAAGFDSASVIKSDPYKASTATVIRFKETWKLSGTTAITLDRVPWLTGTITVWKSDWSASYTRGTEWTGTSDVGHVARTGTAITDGDDVHIEYNASVTSAQLAVGGELADFEAVLRLVYICEGGKALQFYAYRAKKIGPSDNVIQMAAEYSGIPMTFHMLGDMSKNVGSQLFHWALEA